MKKSAGILVYRQRNGEIQVFLVHPGGPFWKNKDQHAWSIPKGEFIDEEPLVAAKREFKEETGQSIDGDFVALEPVKASGKTIYAFAVKSNSPDPDRVRSNEFELEWPPKSGRKQTFPEVDQAAWVPLSQAPQKVHKNQQGVLEELYDLLSKR